MAMSSTREKRSGPLDRGGDERPDSKASILLVDDNPRNLLALQELLNDLGHHLVPAKSGSEALRQCLQQDFALILLDVLMPDMDGFEVAKLIRDRARSRHTDRKSTRLNSSHSQISYAVFCLKKKKTGIRGTDRLLNHQ